MEIKKFEKLTGTYWKPGDKIIKVTLHEREFEIDYQDLKNKIDEYGDLDNALTVYLQDWLNSKWYDYEIVDHEGNVIEDEELFDDTNRYNL